MLCTATCCYKSHLHVQFLLKLVRIILEDVHCGSVELPDINWLHKWHQLLCRSISKSCTVQVELTAGLLDLVLASVPDKPLSELCWLAEAAAVATTCSERSFLILLLLLVQTVPQFRVGLLWIQIRTLLNDINPLKPKTCWGAWKEGCLKNKTRKKPRTNHWILIFPVVFELIMYDM